MGTQLTGQVLRGIVHPNYFSYGVYPMPTITFLPENITYTV